MPAAALAAPVTAHLPTVDPTQPGCEPKGAGGFGASSAFPGANMPPGAYRYIVEAVGAPGNPAPCQEFIVRNPPGSNTNLIQWRPAPGATSYNVYRTNPNGDGTPGAAAPTRVAVLSPANQGPACVGTRCFFVDPIAAANTAALGGGQAAPATVQDDSRAGAHSDLRFVETVDYGGLNPNSSPFDLTDDPFSFDPVNNGANEALRSDMFRFPAGLIANPLAASPCPLTGANSLLGSQALHGSQDPQEDTCSQASFLGTVETVTRVPAGPPANPFAASRLSISFGDIYNAASRGGEPGRLFAVIRPACSAGYPIPTLRPGTDTCAGLLGGNTDPALDQPGGPAPGGDVREVEKEFLTAVANIVERPGEPGGYSIDIQNFDIANGVDEEIKNYQQILVRSGPGGAFERPFAARIPRQLRQLTQHLVGIATQNTAATGDDTSFVTLPTSCGPKTLQAVKTSWDDPSADTSAETNQFTTVDCAGDNTGAPGQGVPFQPALDAGPDTQRETPVGHYDTIIMPGDVGDRHQSHIRDVTAQFPRGLVLSASAGQFISGVGEQIGDVSGVADELGELNGPVELTQVNPDGSFRIQAEVSQRNTPTGADSNVKIKLNALVTPNPATGQLLADFDDLPQVPFRQLQLELARGQIVPLVSPPDCATHQDHLEFRPWSGNAQESVDDGWDTVGCPAGEPPRQFSPSIQGAVNTTQAAATSQLTLTINKPDRQQNLEGFDLELPSGLVTKLSDFTMCTSANVAANACGPESQLGTVSIAAGNGPQPTRINGKVFLAEPIQEHDVASLVVAVPAVVGPFDLGLVVTRSRVTLDPARIGIATTTVDPLPKILKGIPIRIQQIQLVLEGMRNPQGCDVDQFKATFRSQNDPTTTATEAEGGRTATSVAPFQATGCENLPFSPKLAVTAHNEANNHPAVNTVISQTDGEASQQSTKVTMPAGLQPNPAVLQNLCQPDQVAGGCPANSRVGTARANSPLLPLPLTGPVYVVARPGEALPKLVVQLRGILNIDLEGAVSLADGGRLATTFTGLPNTPVTSFALELIGGNADSGTPLFNARADLCNGGQRALGEFTAYNGKTASDNPLVAVFGTCPPPVAAQQGSRNTGQATVSMKIKRVRRGRPVLDLTVRRTRTSANLKRVSLRLPAGLRFRSRPTAAALRGISIRTSGGRQVARRNIRVERGRMVITHTAGSPVFRVTLRRGIVETGRTFRRLAMRRLKARRLTFRVGIIDVQNEAYTVTKRIRPQS